jgi:hypothetical protein
VASAGEGIQRSAEATTPSRQSKQEFAMKKFVFAALAALSLGVGSAYAAQTVTHNGVIVFGPPASAPSYGAGN